MNFTPDLDYFTNNSKQLTAFIYSVLSALGVPSQKPKEQQRSVLRPAVLQAPASKSHIESSKCHLNYFKWYKFDRLPHVAKYTSSDK